MTGLAELSCVVQEHDLTPDYHLAVQLIENALRADHKPIEQAQSYRTLMEAIGWSTRQLGAELSIHPTTITKALAMLDLPSEVQESVDQGGLSPASAYEVSKPEDPAAQVELAQAVVEQKLTRSEVAEAVKAVRARRPAPVSRPDPITIDLGHFTVKIDWTKGGIGPAQALRRALKEIQDRDRHETEAA